MEAAGMKKKNAVSMCFWAVIRLSQLLEMREVITVSGLEIRQLHLCAVKMLY